MTLVWIAVDVGHVVLGAGNLTFRGKPFWFIPIACDFWVDAFRRTRTQGDYRHQKKCGANGISNCQCEDCATISWWAFFGGADIIAIDQPRMLERSSWRAGTEFCIFGVTFRIHEVDWWTKKNILTQWLSVVAVGISDIQNGTSAVHRPGLCQMQWRR